MAASLLLTAQTSFVVAVGLSALASFPLWLAFGPGDPDAWLAQLRNLHLRVGATFLLAGLVGVALRSRARTTKNMAAGETSAGNLRLVLTAGLLILPFWAWNTSDPWLSLWRESWQLIDSLGLWNAIDDLLGLSFAAILAILYLPFLELGTAISFLLTSLIVLLVLWAGKRHAALTLAQCLGVQLAFLLSSFFAVDTFENLNPLLQHGLSRLDPEAIKVSAWLLRQDELAILGARQLMWQCVGYLLLTLVALSLEGRRRVRRIASSESMGEIHSSASLPMTFHEPALRENSEALLARPVSVSALKEGEADGELGYSSYLLKPRSGLPWSLLPGRHAYEISGTGV